MVRSRLFPLLVWAARLSQASIAFSPEAATHSPLFRAPPCIPHPPQERGIKKQLNHAVALAAAALVWRGAPVPEVWATPKVAPIEVRTQNTDRTYVPAAGAVLLATGAGTVLGKKIKQTSKSKREKKESTSSDDDDEHRSSMAKETPPSVGLIRSSSEKVTKETPPVAEVKSPAEPAVNDKTPEILETKISPTSLTSPLTQSTTKMTAPIAKEPVTVPKAQDSDSSTQPKTVVPLTQSTAKMTAPIAKEPVTVPKAEDSDSSTAEICATKVPPKPLVSPVTQPKTVVTTLIGKEPSKAPQAEETVTGRVQNTFSTFSPRKLRDETKHIIEAPRKKLLSRKYAAINDESEKAFTILLDLGMVELHQDPGSPGYDSSMDDQFVE